MFLNLFAAKGVEVDMGKYFEWFKSDYKIEFVLAVAFLGIVIVISILLVLVWLLGGFNKIFEKISKSGAAKPVSAGAENLSETEDAETVAAIVAAISCMYASEGTQAPPFRVRRISRIARK